MATDAQPFEALRRALGLASPDEAREVARTVVMGLHLQLPEAPARQVERLLPEEFQELWAHGHEDLKLQRGSSSSFSRGQFIKWVAEHAPDLDPPRAERAVRVVFAELRQAAPEVEPYLRASLSEGILELWSGTPGRSAPGVARAP